MQRTKKKLYLVTYDVPCLYDDLVFFVKSSYEIFN